MKRSATTDVIEINGKRYNARSGKLLEQTNAQIKKVATVTKTAARKSIDGFGPMATRPLKKVSSSIPTKKTTSDRKAHQPAPIVKKKVQKTQTLHRRGKAAPRLSPEKVSTPTHVPKKHDDRRLDRALSVSKSSIISRFGKIEQPSKSTSTEPSKSVKNLDITAPKKVSKNHTPTPSTITAKSTVTTQKTASDESKSSRKKVKKHASRAGIVITTIVVLALIGYVLYLNVPTISIRIASWRAGFTASQPSYTPAGYSYDGPAKASSNLVTLDLSSNSGQKISLEQRPTNWDTQAVKENYIAAQTETEPLVYQNQGLTVYVYDGKASWVNGEKLYTLHINNSQLGVDQILKLAASV